MFAHVTHEELTAALDSVVTDLLTFGAVGEPPVDTLAVARQLGIVVARDDSQGGRARIVRVNGSAVSGNHAADTLARRPSIFLKHEPRWERQQWAVAHELGEHQAEALFRRLGVSPAEAAPAAREQCANLIANRLLLPSEWFYETGVVVDWDLRQLKLRFETASHELIARRMLDLAPPGVMAVFDQGMLTWRRGSVGGRLPVWSALERRVWERAHQSGADAEQIATPWRVRVWPIHEPDWRREIVRLEFAPHYEPEDWEVD